MLGEPEHHGLHLLTSTLCTEPKSLDSQRRVRGKPCLRGVVTSFTVQKSQELENTEEQ